MEPDKQPDVDFVDWLKRNKLQSYQDALEAEGLEDVESLTLLSDEEIEELSISINMLLGHKRKFPVAISKAREALKEQEEKKKREKEEKEENRKMDMELAKIDRKWKLAKAQAKSVKEQQALVDVDRHSNAADKSTTHSSAGVDSMETKVKGQSKSIDLPANRSYAAFISHKKTHTKHGDSSETLAIRLKDMLKWRSIKAYFDADNLSTISKEKLKEGVEASCCLLLVLNDETLQSAWCEFEIDCARQSGIPVISVCDVDKQTVRSIVDFYMESGYAHLFDEQVIAYSTQSREHSHILIVEAIERAVQAVVRPKQIAPVVEAPQSEPDDRVHELDDASQIELIAALRSKFGTAKAAFDSFSSEKEGTIGKKEWRRVIKKMLPRVSKAEAKTLRKKLPEKVNLAQFNKLMGKVKAKGEQTSRSENTSHHSSHLARLPGEVPVLPTAFKSRPHAHEQLVAALLDSGGSSSTAVTAPKSRVSSQGMGGVGKTMLTGAVVRDERVRGAFERIAWIGMSQQPELLQLQAKLYQQLHPKNEKMPSKADTVDARLRELQDACSQRIVLVCLDDIWDSSHEASFACIDQDTTSRQLITTRIKGLLQGAAEVELELLGLQESVELLAGVACLDDAEISPVCLEIAQLCGRLPLCLSIVGNLIRTFGDSWEQEVPNLIKTDMKSLTDSSSSSRGLNLQTRVIKSGLDSITGDDSACVVAIFLGLAIFAEDQVVVVPIVGVLWKSFNFEGKSSIRLRQWLSDLLGRSILLGSIQDGVSMHDIVRDYTLASHTDIELKQLQRAFIQTMLAEYDSTVQQTTCSKAATIVESYATTAMTYHFNAAITTASLHIDEVFKTSLLHDSDAIAYQVLRAVEVSAIEKLASWYSNEGNDYWACCRLYDALAFKCPQVDKQQSLEFMRKCLLSLEHVPSSQPGWAELKGTHTTRLCMRSSRVEEKGQLAGKIIEWANDESETPTRVRFIAGIMLLGQMSSKFCLNRTHENSTTGAQLVLSSMVEYAEIAQTLDGGFAQAHKAWQSTGVPYCFYSRASIAPADWVLASERILGHGGSILLAAAHFYSFEAYFARFLAASGLCFAYNSGAGAPLMSNKYGNLTMANEVNLKWEDIAHKAKVTEGASYMLQKIPGSTITKVWPNLQNVGIAGALEKQFNLWGVDWYTSEQWVQANDNNGVSWSYSSDGTNIDVRYYFGDALVAYTRALLVAQLPHNVLLAEAAEWMPDVDFQPLRDRGINERGILQALPTLIGTAADRLDMWDSQHLKSFDCIDLKTPSKLLATTRIKGVMEKTAEVELELLGLQEAVGMLAVVAQLDAADISPVCLEIAQLCGRPPLCINIVGNLIRTFGSGWEQEVPGILRGNMKSLAENAHGAEQNQPLNLQQRVISSGLESISGSDSRKFVSLLQGLAVFEEDQVVPVAVLSVLWTSIDPKEHRKLSALKVGQWSSQLLDRSILIGNSGGISTHDIVRDFALASHSPTELQQRQRKFVEQLNQECTDSSPADFSIARSYVRGCLKFHVRGAVKIPLCEDADVLSWLMHSDGDISSQALQGCGASKVNDLALWLRDTKEYFNAGELWKMLAFGDQGANTSTRSQYLWNAREAVAKIPAGTQPGALLLQVEIYSKAFIVGDNDWADCLEWLIALNDDEARMDQLNARGKCVAVFAVGAALLSFTVAITL